MASDSIHSQFTLDFLDDLSDSPGWVVHCLRQVADEIEANRGLGGIHGDSGPVWIESTGGLIPERRTLGHWKWEGRKVRWF